MAERPVTVVGAGFSGLTAAYYLQKAGYTVEVIEQATLAGGLISTRKTPWGLAETAANGALNSVLFEALAQDVGVRLAFPGPRARKRYVFRNGRPRRFPLRASEVPRLAGFFGNFAFNRDAVRPREQETIRTWATRAGGDGFARYLVEAATQGIYSGNPERLSARLIVGRFFEKTKASARPSRRGTVAPEMGMGELIEALRKRLEERNVAFRYGTEFRCTPGMPPHPHVVAAGAHASADIVAPASAELAAALRSFEMSAIVTATLFFREKSLEGFGCLFPPSEQRPVLGVLIPTDIFPNRSREFVAETWMLGGAPGATSADPAALLGSSDEEIVAIILRERERAFGKVANPVGHAITRWPRAIPHYTTDLERVLPRLLQGAGNLFLHGNYLGQIGLAKILERASGLPDEVAKRGVWR
ncbi:MAG TPA: FAD-dependent oxidoreductase [Burkholderiales bacterium]|nr:FAD-dependent oxidoreductase [Burkholderiales bacterium]